MKMMQEREVRLLSLVDVLEPMSEEELRELALRCPGLRVDGGEDLCCPGAHDGALFLVLEGRVRLYAASPTGKQTTLEMLGSGTVLWDRWLETARVWSVHAQAVEPSVVAFVKREDLAHLVLKKPEVGLRMMDLLAERLGSTSERMAEIAQKGVLPRLAAQLLRLVDSEGVVERGGGYRLPSAYTHEELGEMVGASRVAVSRALKELRELGAVETGRVSLRVRDAEILERIARSEE